MLRIRDVRQIQIVGAPPDQGWAPAAPARILLLVKSSLPSPRRTSRAATVPLSVPLLDLRREYDGIREDVLAAIARVCDSQSFILGPEVEALEHEIATLTGAACAVGFAARTDALLLALGSRSG